MLTRTCLAIIVLVLSSFSQLPCPSVSYKHSRIYAISNLNSHLKSDNTCVLETYSGVIASLEYADDSATNPSSLILQLSNGRRVWIGLDDTLPDCLSEVDQSHWNAQLKKNARLQVRVFRCGQSGNSDRYAANLIFL